MALTQMADAEQIDAEKRKTGKSETEERIKRDMAIDDASARGGFTGAAKGAATGAQLGMAAGPVGGVAGALLGGIVGFAGGSVMARKDAESAYDETKRQAEADAKSRSDQVALEQRQRRLGQASDSRYSQDELAFASQGQSTAYDAWSSKRY